MLMSPRTLEKADGMLIFTPESYEPEAVAATRAWYAETGRPVYTTGPLLPSASKSTAMANEKKMSSESNAIVDFLDETLKTSGEKSLVYVSATPLTHSLVLNIVSPRSRSEPYFGPS